MPTRITEGQIDSLDQVYVRPVVSNVVVTNSSFEIPVADSIGSINLDGTGDTLAVIGSTVPDTRNGNFTIEAWVYQTANSGFRAVAAQWNQTVGQAGFILVLNNGIPGYHYGPYSESSALLTGPSALTVNTWHHLAVTRNANVFTLYVNGTNIANATSTSQGAVLQSVNLTIGNYFSSAGALAATGATDFAGEIADVRVAREAFYNGNSFIVSAYNRTANANALFKLEVEANSILSDTSNSAMSITAGDSPVPSTFSPYNGGWSVYFDGDGDYLSTADNAAFDFGAASGTTNDFTIECWFNMTGNAALNNSSVRTATLFNGYNGTSPYNGYRLLLDGNSTTTGISVTFNTYISSTSYSTTFTTGTISKNQWHHLALVRSGSTYYLYLDGTRYTGSGTLDTETVDSPTTIRIGSGAEAGYLGYYLGYISDLRVVKGTAVYTDSSITPPTAPLTAITGTSLLTCQSNRFIDNSPNNFTLTRNGDVKVQSFGPFTTEYRQDPTSYGVFFDGTGDTINLPTTSNTILFNNTNFTIEFWYNFAAAPGTQYFYSQRYDGNNYAFIYATSTTIVFDTYSASSQGPKLTVSVTHQAGAWRHFALVYNNGVYTMYVNGVSVGTLSNSSVLTTLNGYLPSVPLYIGSRSNLGEYFNGHISNLRIVKGTAVYTGAFTPPTSPLATTQSAGTNIAAITDSSTVSLLACQSSTLIDNSDNGFAITASGEARPTTANPFGYTNTAITDTISSMYFDGTNDYLALPTNSDLTLGTSQYTIECWFNINNFSAVYAIIGTSNANGMSLRINNSTTIAIDQEGVSQQTFTVPTMYAGTWYHLAICRNSSNSIGVYLNGVKSSTSATMTNNYSGQINYVGRQASNYFPGYISNLRIVKGTAVYTSNFLPPAAPLTNVANTSLLTLQNRKPYNNRHVRDISKVNSPLVPASANVAVGTYSPYAPTGWARYNGGGSFQILNQGGCFSFGTGDFTIEMWVRTRSRAAQPFLMDGRVNNNFNSNLFFYPYGEVRHGDGTLIISSVGRNVDEPLGQWHHYALVRNNDNAYGNNWCVFFDGVPVGRGTYTSTVNDFNCRLFGRWDNNYSDWNVDISNFRVSKTAVYTDFTNGFTPTGPLQVLSSTSVLAFRDASLSPAQGGAQAVVTAAATANKAILDVPFSPSTITPVGYSVYFDGTGDYLSLANSSALQLGSEDFTIEFWANTKAFGAQTYTPICGIWDTNSPTPSNTAYYVGINAYNTTYKLGFSYFISGAKTDLSFGTATNSTGSWDHYAVVRSGNLLYGFKNGELLNPGGTAITGTIDNGASTDFRIGGIKNGEVYNGYISNLRIVKGTAIYTGAFTPPTGPLATTQSAGTNIAAITDASTVSLLACQSSTVIDNSTNAFTITVNGNSQPTKFNPFGETVATNTLYNPSVHGGSVYFNGSTSYLTAPGTNSNFYLSTAAAGDFTIEAWVYKNTTGRQIIVSQTQNSASPYNGWIFMVDSNNYLRFEGTGASGISATTAFPTNQWVHVAATRSGSTVRIFEDGVQKNSGTVNITDFNGTLTIGQFTSVVAGSYWNGHISDLRILRGVCLYTTPFVPPMQRQSSNVYSVLHLDEGNSAAIRDVTGRYNIETLGDSRQDPSSPLTGGEPDLVAGQVNYIRVLGKGLGNNAKLYIDNEYAASQVTYVGTTELRAVLPSTIPAGTHDIYIIKPAGKYTISTDAVTFI